MLTISAREANQQFSRILETAAQGEEVVITRRGVPVAKLMPLIESEVSSEQAAARERRREEILAAFDRGFEGGALADWTREELYEGRLEHPWRWED